METTRHPLSPPSLEQLAEILEPALQSNYNRSGAAVSQCPDLTQAPFHLAAAGLCGDEKVSDTGGQPNLFPEPRLECKFSLTGIAKEMQMSSERGLLIGAGAGPFHVLGQNTELAPNLSWENGFENVRNETRFARVKAGQPNVEKCPSTDCALMANLYGCEGLPGPVLKVTASGRKGSEKSFTDCIRRALAAELGDTQTVSLGGVFLIKRGKANYHIMPDFPPRDQMPFKNAKQLNDWLTYHNFEAPMVCLSVLHSADPGKKLGLRMEHTHCFSPSGKHEGGHYHYDVESDEEVEYEAYFNTAKVVYRIDKPVVTLERDLHD